MAMSAASIAASAPTTTTSSAVLKDGSAGIPIKMEVPIPPTSHELQSYELDL